MNPQSITIQKLELTFFRNYTQLELPFEQGIQLITGSNGTGKTNLLEAIYLQAVTRSFRTNSDANIVQQEQRFFLDAGIWQIDQEQVTVSCHWMQGRGKKIFWNQTPVNRLSSHVGKLPVVISLPEDVQLIREGGAERRRWLDLLLSQADSLYLQEWIQYEHYLAQRNALLKQIVEGKNVSASELELWTLPLIHSGMILHQKRQSFLQTFYPILQEQYATISLAKEIPHLILKTNFVENTPIEWQNQFDRMKQAEFSLGRTLVGVHRDDLTMELNGKAVRHYSSQGQTKSFILALRFAQFFYLAKQTQKTPILLLDDVFEKLDKSRIEQIAQLLQNTSAQTFITDTDSERMKRYFKGSNVHFIFCPI